MTKEKKPTKRKNRPGRTTLAPELEKFKWKKGQSGNPGGREPEPPELKKLKNLSKAELIEVGNIIIKGGIDDLHAVKNDPNASVLKVMLASIAAKVITKGDMQALDVLLNRLVGKVKDEVDFGGKLNLPQVVVTLPSNGKEAK